MKSQAYYCKSCKSRFSLPLDLIPFYKQHGCPHCKSKSWKRIDYGSLFINETDFKAYIGKKEALDVSEQDQTKISGVLA